VVKPSMKQINITAADDKGNLRTRSRLNDRALNTVKAQKVSDGSIVSVCRQFSVNAALACCSLNCDKRHCTSATTATLLLLPNEKINTQIFTFLFERAQKRNKRLLLLILLACPSPPPSSPLLLRKFSHSLSGSTGWSWFRISAGHLLPSAVVNLLSLSMSSPWCTL